MANMLNSFPGCEVRVATSREDLKKLADWFDTVLEIKDGTDGCCYFLRKSGEQPVAVIWLGVPKDSKGLWPLVAHESTHAAVDYMAYLGEESPSAEFMAYTVEAFFESVMTALEDG